MSILKKLKDKLGVSEEVQKLTKRVKEETDFSRIKDTMPQVEDLNFQADLLFLPSYKSYKYLLTVVDVGTDECDFEPITSKKPTAVSKAFDKIFARPYLNFPKVSIKTDQGTEFKGIIINKFLDKGTYVKKSLPGRHRQTASVEALNSTLSNVIMAYLTDKRKDWIKILPELRVEINKLRSINHKKKVPDYTIDYSKKAKFKVGQLVYRKLDEPRDADTNKKLKGSFRNGDLRFTKQKYEIEKIYVYPGKITHRYRLKGIPEALFSERELKV